WAVLGLVRHGAGRDAARALAEIIARLRPEAAAHAAARRVSVLLFENLRPTSIEARNLGSGPAASSRGYLGPGARVALVPGDRLDDGLWELRVPARGLLRRIRGALALGSAGGRPRLVADVERAEYIAGVLLAELPAGEPERREALGAAVLRF